MAARRRPFLGLCFKAEKQACISKQLQKFVEDLTGLNSSVELRRRFSKFSSLKNEEM